MLEGISSFLASDRTHRPSPFNPAAELAWDVHEFAGNSTVFHRDELTVSAIPVDHKNGNPAFGL